ncbi:sugar phosphate isomerase/epimerase family protein [Spirochaeta cellobiosiphila]|uniref:sugar phosphate isomerase/epimerase family protein n=1 Tax=Spirochaeta cellobiosiphila TaxID=504483 RepID=UPI0004066E7A|nr:sugar phosphate isomerase/epimerase family protein [Spirochaeta cellobiosiphila]
MLNLGMRAHDLGKMTIESLAQELQKRNIPHIHMALAKVLTDYDKDNHKLSPGFARHIEAVLRAHGAHISILGCYINPVHPDPVKLEESLLYFEDHIRHARDMGASIVGTETGSVNADNSYHPLTDTEETFQKFIKSLKRLVNVAENYGVHVAIEGVAMKNTIDTHQKMVRVFDIIDSPNLGVIYDPVNFIPDDRCADHENHIAEAFQLFGDKILAIHAKDFVVENNKKVGDLPAGQGLMNYPFFLKILKEKYPHIHVSLENNTLDTLPGAWKHVSDCYSNLK